MRVIWRARVRHSVVSVSTRQTEAPLLGLNSDASVCCFELLSCSGNFDARRRPFLSQRRSLLPQWPDSEVLLDLAKPLLREQQTRLAMGLVDALLAPYPHRLYASWVHDPCRDWR